MKQLPTEPTFGDGVEISGPAGRGRYRVVGRAVLPSIGRDRIPVADGAVFTGAGIGQLTSNEDPDRYERFLVTFAAGREDEVTARLFPDAVDLRRTEEPGTLPVPPPEVRKLEEVKRLPQVLAVFLALLAMVAIGHAIVTTVQRRRRDLSILKTLGFTRRQLAATIAWQASTPVVVGLVVGVPLGIIAGHWIWTRIAEGLGVALDNSVPVLALALMVPIALLVANLVAALPGLAAARTKPAIVLRSE